MKTTCITAAASCLWSAAAFAQPFQIVATEAPPGSIPQNQWKAALR
jgi:hypothetical protein